MRSNSINLAILLLTGLILLLVGLFLLWYPSYMIGSLQEILRQNWWSNPERDALQGSLNWWLAWGKMTFEPIAYVAFVSGILFLISAALYYAVSIRESHKTLQLGI